MHTRLRGPVRLGVLIRLLLPTLVGETNDSDGDALRRTRFVRLEAGHAGAIPDTRFVR
jgi:hypothetical protein